MQHRTEAGPLRAATPIGLPSGRALGRRRLSRGGHSPPTRERERDGGLIIARWLPVDGSARLCSPPRLLPAEELRARLSEMAHRAQVANLVDTEDDVVCGVRRHGGELPILWSSGGGEDNPDLIVIDRGAAHDGVAVKMNKEMAAVDVLASGRPRAGGRTDVTADSRTAYFVSESDVDTAGAALTKLGQ